MLNEYPPEAEFKIGDSVMIEGTDRDGELATIIAIKRNAPDNYVVVFEDGTQAVLTAENLSRRR